MTKSNIDALFDQNVLKRITKAIVQKFIVKNDLFQIKYILNFENFQFFKQAVGMCKKIRLGYDADRLLLNSG